MVKAHQQAWVWQDEWVDLTMADIRRLELETQEYLKKRMADNNEQNEIELSTCDSNHTITGSNTSQIVDFNIIDKDNENYETLQFNIPGSKKNSLSQYSLAPSHLSKDSDDYGKRRSFQSRSNSKSTIHTPG